MKTRLVILLMAATMICTACVDETETSTTAGATTTLATSTTTPTVSTTVAEPLDLTEYPIPPGTGCFYLAGYLSVPAADAAAAGAALGGAPVAASVVLKATTRPDEPVIDDPVLEGDIDAAISSALAFFESPGDPLQVSMYLRDRVDIAASPIHVLGFTVHIKFQPGTDPSLVPDFELPDVSGTPMDGIVAVVDSGIVPADPGNPVPSWFYGADDASNPYVRYDSIDEEILDSANPASHGTFVSGLIRQIAPSTQVSFASARLVNTAPEIVTATGEALPDGLAPTSEIQVAEAIARLMLRHPDDAETMRALNLSLGTYVCDPASDNDLVTISAMASQWLTTYPLADIFAAAGNENYQGTAVGATATGYVPFFPAALSLAEPRIHGVAAVDRQGAEIVWVDKTPTPVGASGRSWVTEEAPGADLVNLSGAITRNSSAQVIPELVCWSGSSFATAIATAQTSLGTATSKDYKTIDGLTFVETDGSEVITIGGTTAPASACDHDASR